MFLLPNKTNLVSTVSTALGDGCRLQFVEYHYYSIGINWRRRPEVLQRGRASQEGPRTFCCPATKLASRGELPTSSSQLSSLTTTYTSSPATQTRPSGDRHQQGGDFQTILHCRAVL